MKKKRKRHAPEQIVKKLRDADVMLNTGKSLEEVLKVLEVSEACPSGKRAKSFLPRGLAVVCCR